MYTKLICLELALGPPKLKHMEEFAAEYSSTWKTCCRSRTNWKLQSPAGRKDQSCCWKGSSKQCTLFTWLAWMSARKSSCCSANMIRRFRIWQETCRCFTRGSAYPCGLFLWNVKNIFMHLQSAIKYAILKLNSASTDFILHFVIEFVMEWNKWP